MGQKKMNGSIQTQIELDSQKLETTTDVKFQNIIYYYWDGKKSVDQNQQVKIDFLGAVSEMEKLDYKFEKNFIDGDVWERMKERLMRQDREDYDINRLLRKHLYRMFVR